MFWLQVKFYINGVAIDEHRPVLRFLLQSIYFLFQSIVRLSSSIEVYLLGFEDCLSLQRGYYGTVTVIQEKNLIVLFHDLLSRLRPRSLA